jgi:hypothetical protein
MKRFAAVLSAVAILSMAGVSAASAERASVSVTPYTASWTFNGVSATCYGARVVTATTVTDYEACRYTGDTSGIVAGTYSGNPRGVIPGICPLGCRWSSDYDAAIATSWTETLFSNGDGSYTGIEVARY